MQQLLHLHSESQTGPVKWIQVDVERPRSHAIRLNYKLAGDTGKLRIPNYEGRSRTDNLWKHLCFELFVRCDDKDSYLEYNFSPSGEWAGYQFSAYRVLDGDIQTTGEPRIRFISSRQALSLTAEIDEMPLTGNWQIGLSAIIESIDGKLSYWALTHPPGKPDFHHPDCFTLELPSPEAS